MTTTSNVPLKARSNLRMNYDPFYNRPDRKREPAAYRH